MPLSSKLHHGYMAEMAIRRSGYSITRLAIELGINRSTLYRKFEEPVWEQGMLLKLRAYVPCEINTVLEEVDIPQEIQTQEVIMRSYQTFVGLLATQATPGELVAFDKAFRQFYKHRIQLHLDTLAPWKGR